MWGILLAIHLKGSACIFKAQLAALLNAVDKHPPSQPERNVVVAWVVSMASARKQRIEAIVFLSCLVVSCLVFARLVCRHDKARHFGMGLPPETAFELLPRDIFTDIMWIARSKVPLQPQGLMMAMSSRQSTECRCEDDLRQQASEHLSR